MCMDRNWNTLLWGLVLALVAPVLAYGQEAHIEDAFGIDVNAPELTPEEMRAVEYLQEDWDREFRVTAVDQAMGAVGLPPSAETRFRIGDYLRAHPETHKALRDWGWMTIVLTPHEKLIARLTIDAERTGGDFPSLTYLADLIGIEEGAVSDGFAMLERWGMLKRDASLPAPGVSCHFRKLSELGTSPGFSLPHRPALRRNSIQYILCR